MQEIKNLESYEDALFNTDRTSVMLVCINGHRGGQPYGDIVNCHLSKLICFNGVHELILAIDEVCERVGAPNRSTEPRFLDRSRAEQYHELSQKKNQTNTLEKRKAAERIIPFVVNAGAVIVVEVMYRQHASMQGRIHCSYAGTNYVAFRSALELMRMLVEIDEEIRKKGRI